MNPVAALGRDPASAGGRVAANVPDATYRLQVNPDFTLAQAVGLVPYLHLLGVSHCYVSPLLRARPGSRHGYDIVDHGMLNPELGTEAEFEALVDALHRHGMGLILDFVPNHMAVLGSENAWWQDVLENGQASPFAGFFDIDWRPQNEELHGKILLPVLGDPYGAALEAGAIQLRFDGGSGTFRLDYGVHRLPVDPCTYPAILGPGPEDPEARPAEAGPDLLELESLMAAFRHLPGRDQTSPEAMAERARDKEIHKKRLAALWAGSAAIRQRLERNLAACNGTPGDPHSFDSLHHLIKAQGYRLAYWRVAADEINYRRFFDINDLAGIRMELEPVFTATHRLVLDWIRRGLVDGLRLDHTDGLYDPPAYFRRLQAEAAKALGADPGSRPLYLVVEKILARYERCPEDWPVAGETGYRFANDAIGLFVDGAAQKRIDRIYTGFTGRKPDFEETLYRSKVQIIRTTLASELNVLANHLSRIALANRHTCDFTLNGLRVALAEVVACFPVYRTYLAPGPVSGQDRRHLDWAVAAARKRLPEAVPGVFEFIRSVLGCELAQDRNPEQAARIQAFAMKFQQYTAPVMAKGLEDTCCYRHHRLVALNDVGGDSRMFGTSVAAFHDTNQKRARDWPHGLLTTSTHDSKHSEDFRLRVDALSEWPGAWQLVLRRWARMNQSRRTLGDDGDEAPSRNDEYLLYQTLVGAWPLEAMDEAALESFRERIGADLLKAAREAKERTSWTHPNPWYEEALDRFVRTVLANPGKNPFLADLAAAVAPVARVGLLSGLSLVLVKVASPGVPDFYQGQELPVFSLVDPDNRRPVDFAARLQTLDDLRARDADPGVDGPELARSLVATLEDGRAKLFVTWRALNCRRQHPELFRDGDYLPLHAEGPFRERLCAFARRRAGEVAVVAAPRLYRRLVEAGGGDPAGAWHGHRLEVPAPGEYVDSFTGQTWRAEPDEGRCWLPLDAVLAHFPVALLLGGRPRPG